MSIVRGMGAKVAAGGVLVMLALSGCSATPPSPPVTSPPSSTPTPLFANDEEALAAATKAYAAYQAMSDLILLEGGKDGSRVRTLTSKSFAEGEIAGYERALEKGWHSTGETTFSNMTVQDVNLGAPGGVAVVTVYLCSDVSKVDVLDSNGKSLVSPARPSRTPFQVTFDRALDGRGGLVIGSREVWKGSGVC